MFNLSFDVLRPTYCPSVLSFPAFNPLPQLGDLTPQWATRLEIMERAKADSARHTRPAASAPSEPREDSPSCAGVDIPLQAVERVMAGR
jgi:hypothetical protein